MTKDQILSDLFVSADFNACIGKMKPEHLRDDLKSEVMLILCESAEEKIVGLHQAGGLTYYTVRIILNLIQSNTSPFYKKFRAMVDARDPKATQMDNPKNPYDNSHLELLLHKEAESDQEYAGMVFGIIEERERKEKLEDLALDQINSLYWYDQEIVKLYMKLGSYRAIEAETGIPWESCYKTVKRACAIILKNVTENRLMKT